MYVVLALQTDSEESFGHPAKSSPRIPQFLRPPIEVRDHQSALGCLLNFVELIRTLFYCDEIAVAEGAFQFGDARLDHSLKVIPVIIIRRCILHAHLANGSPDPPHVQSY